MPISSSTFFPREMLGVTGLNPLNLLMLATLGSFLLAAMLETARATRLRRFLPRRAVWLYLIPLAIAGWSWARATWARSRAAVRDLELVFFTAPPATVRDMVIKPIMMVIFALPGRRRGGAQREARALPRARC